MQNFLRKKKPKVNVKQKKNKATLQEIALEQKKIPADIPSNVFVVAPSPQPPIGW